MAKKLIVQLTANFERNLEDIERFLIEADAPQAFEDLLDELLETVIPNLQRFPGMGRQFLARSPRSVETTKALETLHAKLLELTSDSTALREYILADYLLLYVQREGIVSLLSIRLHRQLSFDFEAHWGGA